MSTTMSTVSERINGNLLLAPPIEARDLSTEVRATRASEILNSARVNWTVSKRPLYLGDGRAMPNTFALVRDDSDAPLATVGRVYQVNQNTVGLSAFDRLVEAGYLKGYSNAGVFSGGRLAWIQAEMNAFSIGPDEMRGYLALTISHGSRMTDRWCPSTTRIVCRNTFMMSRDAANGGLTIGHTAKGAVEFQSAVARIHAAADMLAMFKAKGEALFRRPMTTVAARVFATELFPSSHFAEGKAEVSGRLDGMRGKVIDLFDNGTGVHEIRGTRWAAFNAVTEYADHVRSTRRTNGNDTEDSRLSSAWFGSGAELKQRALDLLLA